MSTTDANDRSKMLPRLSEAIQDMLADAQVTSPHPERLTVRFDGLPNWKIDISLHHSSSSLVETSIELRPSCIASLDSQELRKLAARENFGLRGVTVIPVLSDSSKNNGRSGLKVRAAFAVRVAASNSSETTQSSASDEVENLAIDILTVLSFARTLEDRLNANTVAGEFSFELYNSRFDSPSYGSAVRFATTGQKVFEGSEDRVFAEVIKNFQTKAVHKLETISARTAKVTSTAIGSVAAVEMTAKIPNEIPMFVVHAPVATLSHLDADSRWDLMERLNAAVETGHFELHPEDFTLSFTAWKHLTNDLQAFSFEHAISSVQKAVELVAEQTMGAEIIEFPTAATELATTAVAHVLKNAA